MAVSPHTWVVLGSVHWGPEGGGQGREEGEGAHSSSTCPSSCGGHEDAAGGERVSTHKGEELREAEQGQHLTPHPVQLGMGFGGGWMVESWKLVEVGFMDRDFLGLLECRGGGWGQLLP